MKATLKNYKMMRMRAKISYKCLITRTFFLEMVFKQVLKTNNLFNNHERDNTEKMFQFGAETNDPIELLR